METKYGYGYVRVSTAGQEELSPDSQAKLLKDYALKNGIIISNIFYELGISGRKAEKRPEFQKMIAQAKSPDHPRGCNPCLEIQPLRPQSGREYRLQIALEKET